MNVQCHACIGGTNIGEDIRKLDYGQHVVSGTPGRVFGKTKKILLITYKMWNVWGRFWSSSKVNKATMMPHISTNFSEHDIQLICRFFNPFAKQNFDVYMTFFISIFGPSINSLLLYKISHLLKVCCE